MTGRGINWGDWDDAEYAADGRRRTPPEFRDAEVTDPDISAWRDLLIGWITTDWRERGAPPQSLLITGPTGVGKTRQAYAIIRSVIEAMPQYGWEAVRAGDLFGEMRPAGDGKRAAIAYERYSGAGLLLLDDIGATKSTPFTDEITDRLIDHRWAWQLPSIYVTNLLISGEPSLESELPPRVVSRLRSCTIAILDGDDRRQPPED
jgi:DNA replication protein DnaC